MRFRFYLRNPTPNLLIMRILRPAVEALAGLYPSIYKRHVISVIEQIKSYVVTPQSERSNDDKILASFVNQDKETLRKELEMERKALTSQRTKARRDLMAAQIEADHLEREKANALATVETIEEDLDRAKQQVLQLNGECNRVDNDLKSLGEHEDDCQFFLTPDSSQKIFVATNVECILEAVGESGMSLLPFCCSLIVCTHLTLFLSMLV